MGRRGPAPSACGPTDRADWRVVYTVEDAVLLVLVIEIGHRAGVYRH